MFPRFWSRRYLLRQILLLLCASSFVTAQELARTAPMTLADMSSRAATIVHGRVVGAYLEPYAALNGAPTMVVTLRAIDYLKGRAAPTFTFRQFVWDVRARYGSLPYKKGAEVVLFMRAPSRYGLSSPVGLEQSRFEVVRSGASAHVINGRGNAGLLEGVRQQAQQRGMSLSAHSSRMLGSARGGPLSLDDFKQLTRELGRSR